MFNRPHRVSLPAAAALLASLFLSGCRHQGAPTAQQPATNPVSLALRGDVGTGKLAILHWPDFGDYRAAVQGFYTARGWDPAWVKGHKPTKQARALTRLFAASAAKGLNPEDYNAQQWNGWLAAVPHASDKELAAFDTAMTVSAMRYISDLHIGRVNPQHFDFGVDVQSKKYDLPQFVAQQVVDAADVPQALAGIEPQAPEYQAVEKALVRYQQLASQTENDKPFPVPAQPLAPGQHYAAAADLANRLVLLGDMSDATQGSTYTEDLAVGVRSFQTRHGMTPSGRLTPATVAALNVPLAHRILQLEDTLERWRWLSPEYQNAPIMVNIPEYVLRAYDPEHKLLFSMKVIVGQAVEQDHQTPVLTQEMKYLVFRPYWVVTPTIIKQELVPHVEQDKNYLADKNFEVITRAGKPVPDWTVDGLAHGRYMVREKPGPANSLGLVKFIFPNKLNIYLHSTPAVQLFGRSKRDFSHGCVRLQDPEKLADWVLSDQPKWTPEAINDAMQNGQDDKIIPLTHHIPVLIFYATARVGDDGKVYFFKDLYGYDSDMNAVLAKGDPFPTKPEVKQQTADTA